MCLGSHDGHMTNVINTGGGVLAHTILGVDYNQDIGSIKYVTIK